MIADVKYVLAREPCDSVKITMYFDVQGDV